MLFRLSTVHRLCFSDIVAKNRQLSNKVYQYERKLSLHRKGVDVDAATVEQFISGRQKDDLAQKVINASAFSDEVGQFVKQFNDKHRGAATMLDFSEYATDFAELKEKPLRQSDIEVLREFQKRKVDQRLAELLRKPAPLDLGSQYQSKSSQLFEPQSERDGLEGVLKDTKQESFRVRRWRKLPSLLNNRVGGVRQGPFEIDDDFVVLLLHQGITTKVTTLNRINSYRMLMFMGNGNGIISYGKARAKTVDLVMERCIIDMKRNAIAIPLDKRCTLPQAIDTRWQDFRLNLRPLPGYNSWGHPIVSIMLSLAGIEHCGFKTVHTGKNLYNAVNAIFKSLTQNTTPQELAEQEGFKVYRRQFIRPLTSEVTHSPLSR